MSLIQFHRIIILFLVSFVFSKEVIPIDTDSKEVLNIFKKDRDYYNLFQDTVIYIVEGPCILEINSRLAFPSLTKKIKPYQVNIVITGEGFVDSLVADHHFRKDLNVFSASHPKYSYTLSGKDVINIPKGKHQVELSALNEKSKILVRLLSRPFKKKRKMSNVEILGDVNTKILKNHKDENSRYFSLYKEGGNSSLFFNVEGPRFVEIATRIGSPSNKDREYYQFKIRENGELKGTYHLFAQKSNNWTQILPKDELDSSVSVKRKSYVKVPKGIIAYELELVYPKNKDVFFRLSQQK